MTPLRRKRLLLIAQRPNPATQRYYAQYCQLQRYGLTGWCLGFAYLTEKGKRELALCELAMLDGDIL